MKAHILNTKYLATLYTAFKQIPPFDKYPLPPASKIKFIVTKTTKRYGRFDADNMAIEISEKSCSHFTIIQMVLLHEMVHLTLYVIKDPGWARHGVAFWKLKNQYSQMYNLDPRAV